MSRKHLTKDSECPPLQNGLIRCYSMRYCPYAQRTLLVLTKKNLNFEVVNLNLVSKPSWYVHKNPLQKVPTLEIDNHLIIDSSHTCEFLDQHYPEPPLHSANIWEKYNEKGLIDICAEKVISPVNTLLFRLLEQSAFQEKLMALKNGLKYFDTLLGEKGTPFFRGETPGMIDYFIWPWFERLSPLQKIIDIHFFTKEEFPHLNKYVHDMKKDDAVKKIVISDDEYCKYFDGVRSGNRVYDF